MSAMTAALLWKSHVESLHSAIVTDAGKDGCRLLE